MSILEVSRREVPGSANAFIAIALERRPVMVERNNEGEIE